VSERLTTTLTYIPTIGRHVLRCKGANIDASVELPLDVPPRTMAECFDMMAIRIRAQDAAHMLDGLTPCRSTEDGDE
jgi:hypothetical protein